MNIQMFLIIMRKNSVSFYFNKVNMGNGIYNMQMSLRCNGGGETMHFYKKILTYHTFSQPQVSFVILFIFLPLQLHNAKLAEQ